MCFILDASFSNGAENLDLYSRWLIREPGNFCFLFVRLIFISEKHLHVFLSIKNAADMKHFGAGGGFLTGHEAG